MRAADPLGRSLAERKAWLASLKRGDVVVALDGDERHCGVIARDGDDLRWNFTTIVAAGQYAGRVAFSRGYSTYVRHLWLAPAEADEANAWLEKERVARRLSRAGHRIQRLGDSHARLTRVLASMSNEELSALESVLDRLEAP